MQIAEIVWHAEVGAALVVRWQQYAEVIVPDVRGKVIPDDALNAFVGLMNSSGEK